MPTLIFDYQTTQLLLTAAITFAIGAFAGYHIARFRLSDVEFCKMQLRRVKRAVFQKQRLMNFSEFVVFRTIEQDPALKRAGYRLVAQAPLGEILQSQHKKGFHAVNGRRVDMLIVDRGGWPVLAIEYQGEGHYDATSDLRDAMKRTALTNAGVGYLEIFPKDKADKDILLSRVHAKLGWNAPAQQGNVHELHSNIRAVHP
ncbi:MAG: DUF2726 domain-containing protein [Rhizomicrobium sp.]